MFVFGQVVVFSMLLGNTVSLRGTVLQVGGSPVILVV
jgi:hypothetical protein